MTFGNFDVLIVGLVAVLVGGIGLAAMVRYDLGPKSRLARGGRWLLTIALGTGVLAFALKLGIILTVASAPQVMIDPLIARPPPPRPEPMNDPLYGLLDSSRFVWTPLPAALHGDKTRAQVWQALPETAPAPRDNPTTPERVALGKRLFFDKNLSRDRTVACASCHDVPGGTGVDGRPTSVGIGGQVGGRNAPTVWNAAFQAVLFWDGRAVSLEEQSKGPPLNPIEMGMESPAALETRVRENLTYRDAFARAFNDAGPITIDRIAKAIAAYERTLITPDSPYDRFVRGDLKALSPAQLRGMGLFQAVGCVNCHSGPNFSAASVFDSQAPMRVFPTYPTPYAERYGLTRDVGAALRGSNRGSWRVPSLRNVALTGPWFHNGSVAELAEAVRIMANGQLGRTGPMLVWSDSNKVLVEMDQPALTEREVQDIVAFLNALTSDSLLAMQQGSVEE